MTPILVAIIAVLGLAIAGLVALLVRQHAQRSRSMRSAPSRVLLPFLGEHLSQRALDAALRLARADHATLVPAFILRVPYALSLEAPAPRECDEAFPVLEAIEQRATRLGVPVDSRIERGRDARHALRRLIAGERYDRLVIAATDSRVGGFHTGDVAWLLDHAPGEIVVVRPPPSPRPDAEARRKPRRRFASRSRNHANVGPWPARATSATRSRS